MKVRIHYRGPDLPPNLGTAALASILAVSTSAGIAALIEPRTIPPNFGLKDIAGNPFDHKQFSLHDEVIREAAETYKLDYLIASAVAAAESQYNPSAQSFHRNDIERNTPVARGMFQLKKFAVIDYLRNSGHIGHFTQQEVWDSWQHDLRVNAHIGVWYFKHLLERNNNDLESALIAYNAGQRIFKNALNDTADSPSTNVWKYLNVSPEKKKEIASYVTRAMVYYHLQTYGQSPLRSATATGRGFLINQDPGKNHPFLQFIPDESQSVSAIYPGFSIIGIDDSNSNTPALYVRVDHTIESQYIPGGIRFFSVYKGVDPSTRSGIVSQEDSIAFSIPHTPLSLGIKIVIPNPLDPREKLTEWSNPSSLLGITSNTNFS